MPSTLNRAVNKRNPMRKQVESLYLKTTTQIDSLTEGNLIGTKTQLEGLLANLTALNNEIIDEMDLAGKDDLSIQQEGALCLDYEMKINEAIANIVVKLTSIQNQNPNNTNVSFNNSASFPSHAAMKLPEVSLPEFSGKETESLEDFLTYFEATMSQITVSPFQKFLYFKKSILGDAAKLISNVVVTDQAYANARSILERAYEPTVKKKFKILENLVNANMTFKDHVYDHYSKLQSLFEAYDRVNIDHKCIKQFFAWRSFTGPLQESFITVTGKYKPDYDDIERFKFEAAERYNDKQKKFNERQRSAFGSVPNKSKPYFDKPKTELDVKPKSKNESSSFASNVPGSTGSKPIWCRLCYKTDKPSDHKVFNCPQFPTAQNKIDRILKMGGCIKCAYSNHKKDTCKFPFNKKCRHCNGSHLSWLCLKGETADVATEDPEVKVDSDVECESDVSECESDGEIANLCAVRMNRACLPSNSILPTVEVRIGNKKFRVMRDSGCQKNFVNKAIIEQTGIKPKGKSDVVINGFNASKKYQVQLADIPFEFGGKKFKVEAIILPDIAVQFTADGLSYVANEFVKKGYTLADPSLIEDRNGVYQLQAVFGSDTAQIFNEQTVVFGGKDSSAYLNTLGGVMLVGSSLRMIKNLDHLPINQKSNSHSAHSNKSHKSKTTLLGVSSLVNTDASVVLPNAACADTDFGKFIGNDKPAETDLQRLVNQTIGYDPNDYNDQFSELDERLVEYTLDKT